MSALAVVTSLNVSPGALRHRNVRAAHMVARSMHDSRENVIGTANDKGPITQLYGWCNSVSQHTDYTGYVYFMPLKLPRHGSIVYADPGPSLALEVGTIYRLDDYCPHGTYEDGPVVCLMRGPYKREADGEAIVALYQGLQALEQRAPDAPRVMEGFHHPIKGECWVLDEQSPGGAAIVRQSEAKRRGLLIAECGKCAAVAFHLDHHFPYFEDKNRCIDHFLEDIRE